MLEALPCFGVLIYLHLIGQLLDSRVIYNQRSGSDLYVGMRVVEMFRKYNR